MSDEDIRERIIRLHDTMIGRPYAERIGPLEQAGGARAGPRGAPRTRGILTASSRVRLSCCATIR